MKLKILSQLLIATKNRHKTCEIQSMLGANTLVTDITGYKNLIEIEEIGKTFEENSRLKAEGISRQVSGLVLADDSGLEVDVLGKEPGVYSARYAGIGCSDNENIALVLKRMKGFSEKIRTARFYCVLAVAEKGVTQEVFHGVVEGIIADEVKGEGGFGYDPIFMPIINGKYEKTFGELSPKIKHTISHRSCAIAQFCNWWTK